MIRVWYAAGTAAGDAIPDAWRGTDGGSSPPSREHEFGWSVPGYGALATHRDADDVSSRFLVAPGPAMRPAAWFPCVDDGASLVHFSANVTVESDLTVVAPGVLLRSELVDVGEDDGGERLRRRKFAFASGGVPTQAHQMVLAVGKFAARRIPASSSATSAFAAAAAAEEEDKEAEEKEAAKRDATEAASLDERANAVDAHAHSSTHALFAPRDRGAELRAAASAAAAATASFEKYLGRPFPYPGGLAFVFVPPDAMPTPGTGAGDVLPAMFGAGVTVVSTDRLAHPLSAVDTVLSRTVVAECAARQMFGGFLEPREETDAWLAEGLASHLAGKCYVASLMGGDEFRYRRARETEAVVAADDGDVLPPLASAGARIWRGGRRPGGSSAAEAAARRAKETANGAADDANPAPSADHPRAESSPPRPMAPETDLLTRWKATSVIGMLERRLGDEGLQKVLKKLVGLQAKAHGAEALQERAAAAAKASRAARDKAKAAAEAAKTTEGADEGANASAKEKAASAAREQLKREHEEAAAYHALAESPARFLRTAVFLTLCRQNATMTKNEMAAFQARWIEGCGCPRLTAGFTFRKSRRQELLFAIKLDGCAAAAAADRVAFRKNAKISVTVRVQETDLPPSDHAVSLSAHDRAYCLMPLQLVTKPKDRRTIARQQQAALDRQQRAIEEGIVNPESLDAAAAAEVLQWECPVQWVRVDPEGEWLADVRLPVSQVGLEGMITAQLTKERPADVASQIAAISHLEKRAEAGSTSAVNALLQCAEDPNTFCRVRADAARSLGKCARDATQRSNLAATSVQRAYRRRRCDPATGLPAPTTLTNLAESIVDEGFVHALGAPRVPGVGGARWTTPVECVELLTDALDHHDADGDPHDGSSLVAAALTALGSTRPPTVASVVGAARAIRRWLWHDAAVCGVGGATHAGADESPSPRCTRWRD